MTSLLALIPGFPLAAFVVLILIGRRLGRLSAWLSVSALAGSCALTWSMAGRVLHGERLAVQWAWLADADALWRIGLAVDGLTWLMLAIVTTIGSLIQLYSIGYMFNDARFSRFFAYLSLFCGSMLTLVMADHFLLLYAGWELVGLCSYLLISFWFEKPAAANAGLPAAFPSSTANASASLAKCTECPASPPALPMVSLSEWMFLFMVSNDDSNAAEAGKPARVHEAWSEHP